MRALQEALANAEESTEKKLATAKKNLKSATEDAATTLEKVTNVTSTDVDPDTKEEIEELESNIKKQQAEIRDESITMLSDCIRLLVLKKMDKLTLVLVFAVDKLFDSVEELYKTQSEFKLDQQQLRDAVYHVVETIHTDFQAKVSLEVQLAVTILEAMMDDSGDDDDDAS